MAQEARAISFYTNARVLIPATTFYDPKLQTLVAAKSSRISPNHT